MRKSIIEGKFGGEGPDGPGLDLRSFSGKPAALWRRVVTTRVRGVRERPGRRGPGGGRLWGRLGLWRPRGISDKSWALEAQSRAGRGTSGQQEAWRVSGTSGPREAGEERSWGGQRRRRPGEASRTSWALDAVRGAVPGMSGQQEAWEVLGRQSRRRRGGVSRTSWALDAGRGRPPGTSGPLGAGRWA